MTGDSTTCIKEAEDGYGVEIYLWYPFACFEKIYAVAGADIVYLHQED